MSADHRWFKILPPVVLCALLWGSAFPAIKTVYRIWSANEIAAGPAEFWWFAGVRFVLAGVILLIAAKRPMAELSVTPKRRMLCFTLTQTVGQYVFFYLAIALASGSLAGLLTSLGSFWWMILSPLMVGTPWPNRWQWVALVLGAVGITVATGSSAAGLGNPLLGCIMMILATGCGAVGIIVFGSVTKTMGARAGTGFSLFGGGLVLLLMGISAFPDMSRLMTPPVMLLTLWLSVVSAAAFSLWNYLSTLHPVSLLASYRFLIPLAGMAESLIFLKDERADGALVFGAVLVAGGLVIAQRSRVWSAKQSRQVILGDDGHTKL